MWVYKTEEVKVYQADEEIYWIFVKLTFPRTEPHDRFGWVMTTEYRVDQDGGVCCDLPPLATGYIETDFDRHWGLAMTDPVAFMAEQMLR